MARQSDFRLARVVAWLGVPGLNVNAGILPLRVVDYPIDDASVELLASILRAHLSPRLCPSGAFIFTA